jgi:ferredoxin
MNEVLELLPRRIDELPAGIHPQREVVLRVDQARCIGCGACVARAPEVFQMMPNGQAMASPEPLWWSPLGDHLLTSCPTHAIIADQTWPAR